MDTTTTQPNNQPVDQQALQLTHAIALAETGTNGKPDYNASGASGEKGAYQWMPGNFQSDAKSAGLDPNDFSPENQDKVAYAQIKAYKDKGYDPGQIASLWNSGSPNNWQDHSGTNKEGVSYNTPAYVKNVQNNYQKLSGQQNQQSTGYQPPQDPNSPSQSSGSSQDNLGYPAPVAPPVSTSTDNQNITPSDPNSLTNEISGRVNDASQAISDTMSGKINPVSGLLQGVGAVAGGLGDVVNKGLELIPGVKAIEGVIGTGIGKLAQTVPGQAIVKSLKAFGTAHPELTKDLGAGFNIVTALPILDGLGALKNVALDGVSQVLKSTAENAVEKDLTATTARTIGGKLALANGGVNDIKTLITERALPDIIDNKYATKDAFNSLSTKISSIEDNELQPALKSVSTSGVDTKVPLEDLRQQALQSIKEEFKSGGNVGKAESEVNRVFDDYKNSYGDYVSLEDVNDMKRGIRKTVNFNSPKLESDVTYHIGQTFQKSIEDSATKLGLPDVGQINQKMATLIKAQKALKFIEGKPVKTGLVSGMLRDVATAGGEMAGTATGIPIAGAVAGREAGGYVGKKLAGISKGILDRTAPDAVKLTREQLAKKMGLLFGGAVGQKASKGL